MLVQAATKLPQAKATAPAAAAQAATPTREADRLQLSTKKPVQAQAVEKEWTLGRIAKTAGVGVGGFVAGNVATFVVDLFFHFGNNGGTAFAGPIYLAAAGAVAVGAMLWANRK